MRDLSRIKALVVTGAVALGGIALAAAPAHAGTGAAGLSAAGGQDAVLVTGYGFKTGASVNINILEDTDGGTGATVTGADNVTVGQGGHISQLFTNLDYNNQPVWVAANQLYPAPPLGLGGTLFAQTTISPATTGPLPDFAANGTGQLGGSPCIEPLSVQAIGFQPGTSVQLELWTNAGVDKMLSETTVPVDHDANNNTGEINTTLPTDGYEGLVWITATQSPNPDQIPLILDEVSVC
jgi:hypothetical protein